MADQVGKSLNIKLSSQELFLSRYCKQAKLSNHEVLFHALKAFQIKK